MWLMVEEKRREGRLIHPRIPDDLHAELLAYAETNQRSVNNSVVYLLRKGLESEEGPS